MRQLAKYQVFIIEDHAAVRTTYQRLIEREPDMQVCGEVDSGERALEVLRFIITDVVILDLLLPGISGMALLPMLKDLHPDLRILVVSGQDKYAYATGCLKAGASGYLDKGQSAQSLTKAIREVARGNVYLDEELQQI